MEVEKTKCCSVLETDIQCSVWDEWYHAACESVSKEIWLSQRQLGESKVGVETMWACIICQKETVYVVPRTEDGNDVHC